MEDVGHEALIAPHFINLKKLSLKKETNLNEMNLTPHYLGLVFWIKMSNFSFAPGERS
jgi:hypothetical protein